MSPEAILLARRSPRRPERNPPVRIDFAKREVAMQVTLVGSIESPTCRTATALEHLDGRLRRLPPSERGEFEVTVRGIEEESPQAILFARSATANYPSRD